MKRFAFLLVILSLGNSPAFAAIPDKSITLDMNLMVGGKHDSSPRLILPFDTSAKVSDSNEKSTAHYSIEVMPKQKSATVATVDFVLNRVENNQTTKLFTASKTIANGETVTLKRSQAGLPDVELKVKAIF